MMEFNQNLEIAMFVSCVVSSCIHFPVLRQEGEAEAGADDLLAARQDDALPPAETFPINKFKQLSKFFKSCVKYFICVNQEFEKKGKIKAVFIPPPLSHQGVSRGGSIYRQTQRLLESHPRD